MVHDPDAVAGLDQAVTDLDLTIKDIRGTIFDLQRRQGESLRAEIRTLVREYVSLLGFTPAVRTAGPIDTAVPLGVRAELIPVLREAISNVARHARAGQASVDVRLEDQELRLTVADDGVGLPDRPKESGLSNVRRRALSLGGAFEVSAVEPHSCGGCRSSSSRARRRTTA